MKACSRSAPGKPRHARQKASKTVANLRGQKTVQRKFQQDIML